MYKIYKITSHPTVDFAAEELKKYLRMMMTECGEIEISYAPDAKDGFRLGLMSDLSLDTSEAADLALDDIIHIDTDCEGGIIAGSNVRSVLLAVYKYLTLNGCRWLFPGIDGELIPAKDVEPTKFHKMADNRYRGWCNEGAEFQYSMLEAIDYAPKIGLNIFMLEFFNPQIYYSWYYNHPHNKNREAEPVSNTTVLQWKRQCEAEIAKRSLQFHDIGHGWTTRPFGARDEDVYAGKGLDFPEENKKYLALLNGKRDFYVGRPNHTNFCFSNEKARKMVVDFMVDHAEANKHVDYLHFWLADSYNNHCECEECKKKTPSDWYVITLNDIDAELTRRNINTRLVFCAYVDTTWAPVSETINNPDRFTLLLGAISRDYTKTVSRELPDIELPKYVHNSITLPKTLDEYVLHAKAWQKCCKTSVLTYEYHFYVNQFFDPGMFHYAKVLYDDVIGYSKHGFLGMIEDGTQRCFFPNGLNLFIYASTLFDMSSDFNALVDDYFSHAYGEDHKTVKEYFTRLGEIYEHAYLSGNKFADRGNSRYYSPEHAEKMRGVYALNEEFRPFFEAHKNMPMRAQTVAFKLLRRFAELWEKMARPLILKAYGADDEAKEAYSALLDDFGKYEPELELWFDHHQFGMAYDHRFTQKSDIMNIGAQ